MAYTVALSRFVELAFTGSAGLGKNSCICTRPSCFCTRPSCPFTVTSALGSVSVSHLHVHSAQLLSHSCMCTRPSCFLTVASALSPVGFTIASAFGPVALSQLHVHSTPLLSHSYICYMSCIWKLYFSPKRRLISVAMSGRLDSVRTDFAWHEFRDSFGWRSPFIVRGMSWMLSCTVFAISPKARLHQLRVKIQNHFCFE